MRPRIHRTPRKRERWSGTGAGNLPALLAYLSRMHPLGSDNPEPPEEGTEAHRYPDANYEQFGNLPETAEGERERWRQRVEWKLRQIAGQ